MKQTLNIIVLVLLSCLISACKFEASDEPENSDGVATPTADFIIQNDHLITIESNLIKVYSLTDPANPQLEQTYNSADNLVLESIYAYKTNMLMIGTTTGSFFQDHSTPGVLENVTFSELFTSCDAVITQGNYLYITLNDNERCSEANNTQGANQLLVYNILQIDQPSLEKTITLEQPYGLGINGTNLFVCNDKGVIEFDITDPTDPKQVADYSQPCNDIIANEDPMILTDESGIRFVEYADPGLTELSIIRKGE